MRIARKINQQALRYIILAIGTALTLTYFYKTYV
jgi:hypothetical protein